MEKTKRIDIVLSKGKNIPCLWEEGGGYTSTGDAVIIASQNGEKPHAIYVRRKGSLACGKHALVPIKQDMYIIFFHHHREDFTISVNVVRSISEKEQYAEIEEIHRFEENSWDNEVPEFLKKAIEAGIEKATCYHCRSPYFVIEPQNRII